MRVLGDLVELGGAAERARRREALARRIRRVLARRPAARLSPAPLLDALAPRRLGLVRAAPPLDAVARRVARFARPQASSRITAPDELRALSRRRLGLVRDSPRRP